MKFILDTHCHTISSGHAYSTVKEYVDEAVEKKLQLIAITDHGPNLPGSPTISHFVNQKEIPSKLKGVEILRGVEANILNTVGEIDLNDSILRNLDLIIASMHLRCFQPGTVEWNTKAILRIMDNPNIHIIGHLGDPIYPIDVKKIVKTAKDTNTIIELNNASLNPNSFRAGGEKTMIEIMENCKKEEVPIVIGSDAHFYTDIGDFSNAHEILETVDFPEKLILNTSKKKLKKSLSLKNDY